VKLSPNSLFPAILTVCRWLTGGVFELTNDPAELAKLKADYILISNRAPDIIRYQTPLMPMRRLATKDTILGGQQIRKGEIVVKWYISGHRGTSKIDRPDELLIDRKSARNHIFLTSAFIAAWAIDLLKCNDELPGKKS
jgi:cytochrome P450